MFGVLARAKTVKKRTLSLVQLNVELAKLEAKQKATAIGTGAGLAAVAGVLVVYGIGFAFAAAAAGLSEALSLWLSLLIVAGILFLAAAIAAFLAVRFVRRRRRRSPSRLWKRRPGRWRRSKAVSGSAARGDPQEIAAERQRLDDDLTALQGELRSLVPLAAAGLAVVALVTFARARARACG